MSRICVVCKIEILAKSKSIVLMLVSRKVIVKLQTNTYHSQTLRAISRKVKLVKLFSGGCQKCGYCANLSALHFHHVNPTINHFKLDARVLSNKK